MAPAEPVSANSLRKRANGSTMKLPPKVVSVPPGSHSVIAPASHQERDRQPADRDRRVLAAEGAQHQQRHGAEREHDLGQSRQQGGKCGDVVHRHYLSSSAAVCAVSSACV